MRRFPNMVFTVFSFAMFLTTFLFAMLLFSGDVVAESLLPLTDFEAKSKTDPLYLEMPDEIHQMMPVKVKLYINDETIKKEAKYIELSAGTATPFSSTEKISIDPSGVFRQTIAYNGQDTIEFGFRPTDYAGQTSSVYATFYKTKAPAGNAWPDTSAPDNEFREYNCHTETNKLMCDKKDGCVICNQVVGTVIQEFVVSKSIDSASPPSRFAFTNVKDTDQNLRDYAPQYEKFTYSGEKTLTGSDGKPNTMTETYTVELDITNTPYSLKSQKEFMYNFLTKQQGMTVTDTAPPGGLTGEYAFQGVAYTPNPDGNRGFVYMNAGYELYAEMLPLGSGMMKVTATRATIVPSGGSDAEKDAVIAETKAFAASYLLSNGAVLKADRDLMHKYSIRSKAKEEVPETTELSIFGTIADVDKNPLPFIELEAQVNGKKYPGRTGPNGDFSILLDGLQLGDGEKTDGKLVVLFNYERDAKQYFKLYSLKAGSDYSTVKAMRKFTITQGANTEINLRFDGTNDPLLSTNLNAVTKLKHLAVTYRHLHEATDFALTKLHANIDYKLPVEIYVGNMNKKTLYDPSDSSILISSADASYSSSNRPKNREYHEFAHHIMFSQYGAWPDGRLVNGVKNHDGYWNPNTGDSYLEGFAEFIALAIAKDVGDKTPEIYAGFGSLENNYKPWDARGTLEEFAVASLLWDMYDTKNDKGDTMAMSLDDIWSVLKVKHADMYAYYGAFKSAYPKNAKQIDDLFIAHGFFEDTRVGNKKFDIGEPWKYTNETAGEYDFIDMSGNVTKITYQNGFTVGKSADYARLTRSSAVRVPNAYIKVIGEGSGRPSGTPSAPLVDYYTVHVDFKDAALADYDYDVDVREGLIYLMPLPDDIEATFTIKPKTNDFTSKSFTIDARRLNAVVAAINSAGGDAGYVAEHDFQLKPNGGANDIVHYDMFDGVAPTYDYEGDIGTPVEKNILADGDDGTIDAALASAVPLFFKIMLGVVLLFVIVGIAVVMSGRTKKKHQD